MSKTWLRAIQAAALRTKGVKVSPKSSRRVRLGVESLEARWVPATLTVTNLNDAGVGSLRQAVLDANAASGADDIVFQSGLTGTIALTSGEMAITDAVTVTGNGAAKTVIDAQQASRIFNLTPSAGNVTFANLALTKGKSSSGFFPGFGGAILSVSTGTLTVSNSVLSHNSARTQGGAISAPSSTVVVSNGTLVTNNTAQSGGGIDSDAVVVTDSKLTNNSATALGGAISTGSLTVNRSTFTSNTAADGAAIDSTSGTITNSTFDLNSAQNQGGAVLFGTATATVTNSTFFFNMSDRGAAIYSRGTTLTVLQSTLDGNVALQGNAIYMESGSLAIQNSIVQSPNSGNVSDVRPSPNAGDAFTVNFSLIGKNIGTGLAETGETTPDANGNLIGGHNGIQARTGDLADYGGPTKTLSLLPGSIALNRGSNALAAGLSADQRGQLFGRVFGGTVDMGSFEAQTISVVVDTNADEDDGNYAAGDLSLREAIRLTSNNPGADTITFASSTNGTDFDLTLGLMRITDTLTITGNGAANTVIDAQQLSRIFDLNGRTANPDLTVQGVSLLNGKTTSGGAHAAIESVSRGLLTVTDSVLSGNIGGAIFSLGAVTVTRSTLSGNTGTVPFSANAGVAISTNGAITVTQSTLSGNTGGAQGGAIRGGTGGVTVVQSTLTGNTAYSGGAIHATTGAVTVVQSTITGNTATGSIGDFLAGGGGIASSSAPVTIRNSIVAGNTDNGTAPDVLKSTDPADPFVVEFSLIGKSAGTGLTATGPTTPDANGNLLGDAAGIDPKLAPLANNGGPTQTMALLAGSPAFNRGSNTISAPFTFDQRGTPFARVVSGTADMGAIESPPQTDLQITKTAPVTTVSGQNLTYTITITNAGAGDAALVVAADALPTGTTFVSLTQNSGPSFTPTTPAVGSGGNVVLDANSFAAGSVATFTLVVNVGVSVAGQITNRAQVATTTLETDPSNNASTVITIAVIPDDIQIYKTAPATVDPGANLTYTITVANTGTVDALTVLFADNIPANTTFVSVTQTSGPAFSPVTTPPVGGTGLVSLDIASLPAGQSATFTLVVNVSSGLTGGTITNTAQVASATPDPDPTNNTSTTTTAITQADVSVAKSGPATVIAGQDLVYTITFSNGGTDAATNVVISDALPAGTTFVSLTQNAGGSGFTTSTPGFGSGGTVTISTPSLAVGTVATYTLVVRVPSNQTAGVVSNTATATSLTPDTDPSNNSSLVSTNITTQADLAVFKDGPATVTAGTDMTYTIVVGNFGPSYALDVAVSDALPAGTTFVSLTQTSGPAFTLSTPAVGANGTVTLTLASLPDFEGATFTLVVHVGSGVTGTLTNTTTSTLTTPDAVLGDRTSSVTTTVTTASDLQVTTTTPTSVVAGQTLAYTFTVTNTGPSDALNVSLADLLPAGTTFVSLTQNGGPAFTLSTPAVGGTGAVGLTAGSLAAGATATFTLVVRVDPAVTGTVANTVTGTAATTDTDPASNSSTVTTTVTPAPDLVATATVDRTAAFPGDVVTYTVVVTNTGTIGSPGVAVSVPFSADLGSVTWTAVLAGGATGAASGSGDISQLVDLPAGASITYTVRAVVLAGRRVTIPTAVLFTPGSVADPDPSNNTASVGVIRAPEIEIVGAASGAPHVKVFAALDGRLLRSFFAYAPAFGGGVSVAQGDVNGDGVNDVVTGAVAGGAPHVKVFDGLTGALLASFFAYDASFRNGVYVAAGDVDGDGFADVVTGAGPGGAPHVKVFDGRTFAERASFFAYDSNFRGGVTVAAGDVDGDGDADVVTGAGAGGAPHVKVFDGRTRAEKSSFLAYREVFAGGLFVAVGDVNGDGLADVVTGAGPTGGPRVRAFTWDGAAESVSFYDGDVGFGGGVRVAVGDYDGDGVDDILAGFGPGGSPLVKRYRGSPTLSGSTADAVESFLAFDAAFTGGVFVG